MSIYDENRVRKGKTARDKANGHIPGRKNRKVQGERGHRCLVAPWGKR